MKRKLTALILAISMIVTMMPISTFAASKYVKSLKVSDINISTSQGITCATIATVKVKGKASKKIKVSVSDSKLVKVTTKYIASTGKTKIMMATKKPGNVKITVKTIGKSSKGKTLSKTIKLRINKKSKTNANNNNNNNNDDGNTACNPGNSGGNIDNSEALSPDASAAELNEIRALANTFTNMWYSDLQEKIAQDLQDGRIENSELYIANQIKNNSFNDLSGVLKLYALTMSNYFSCKVVSGSTIPTTGVFGMKYMYEKIGCSWKLDEMSMELQYAVAFVNRTDYTIKSSDIPYFKRLLNNLINNRAAGTCSDYATYEYIYFKTLGWDVYCNKNTEHAWTVVKTTNSDGKIMWIPFDYGMERTIEALTYNYTSYVEGIPNVPIKDYTFSDFK